MVYRYLPERKFHNVPDVISTIPKFIRFLVSVLTLLVALATSDSSSIERCLNIAPRPVKGEMSVLINSGFFLYKLEDPVSWCEAYHHCRQIGCDMASIKAQRIQERLEIDIHDAKIRGIIWLSARRKDFGENWTWINESLTDCRNTLSDTGEEEREICLLLSI